MKLKLLLKDFQETRQYGKVDLSKSHLKKLGIDIQNSKDLSKYLDNLKLRLKVEVLYGGFLEKRALYDHKLQFYDGQKQRNIHLGVDFWAKAEAKIIAPIHGVVHSFADNNTEGNYGPTLILEHHFKDIIFYSLYGHLSLDSIASKSVGQIIEKGEELARLGDESVNGGYVPHLHFQLMNSVGGYHGDYPGVCSADDLELYKNTIISPLEYLGL